MPRAKRSDTFHHSNVAIAHCVQRCVRRAFLAGDDPVSGKSFEYRRDWIRKRLELLAAVFGIDVLSYSVMSNHVHLVLRTRPDVVKSWDDLDVAKRWLRLFPGKRLEEFLGEPTKQDIANLAGNAKRLVELRKRLSDISWFMRSLCEPIARKANQEDKCTGRFWEGRFKAQKILDEAGLLACAMYVDLNPIRAAMVTSPEKARFTSAYDRIASERGALTVAAARESLPDSLDEDRLQLRIQAAMGKNDRELAADLRKELQELQAKKKLSKAKLKKDRPDAWMAPLELDERGPIGPRVSKEGLRASDKGFLPMRLSDYLSLLDWTGKQRRDGKRGAIPSDLAPILERLGIEGTMWCDLVWDYAKYFGKSRAAGRPEKLKEESSATNHAFVRGQRLAKACFLS